MQPLATLEGHIDRVNAVAFSPDGTLLVSGSDDASVRLWDVAERAALGEYYEHASFVKDIVFAEDGFYSASWDRSVIEWQMSAEGTSPINTLSGYLGALDRLAYRDSRLAVGVGDGSVQVVDAESRETLLRMRVEGGLQVTAVALNETLLVTAAGFPGEGAQVWDIETGDSVSVLPIEGTVTSILFLEDALLALATERGDVTLWDVSDAAVPVQTGSFTVEGWITSLAYESESDILWLGLLEGRVEGWRLENAERTASFTAHDGAVNDIAITTAVEPPLLASAGEDGLVRLWTLPPAQP
ncbi:MAG: hypothetical protein SF029_23050 [bacterium]|nr:hypothetical protein [bacterium]